MKGGKGYKKGFWIVEEDIILMEYVRKHGKGKWNRVANMTGLKRCGKSCRLRWINYICPSVNRYDFTEEEDDLIIRLHNFLGNRWSLIAGRVPGRTVNQVKNHWNTYLSKKLGVKNERNNKVKASSSQKNHWNTYLSKKLGVKNEKNNKVKASSSQKNHWNTYLNKKLGVENEKNNKVKASSSQTPFTAMEAKENFNISMETNCCAASAPPANQKAIEDGVENTNRLFDGLELTMNDGSESSFWLVNDDIYNLNTPQLTELLDQGSLDFIWNEI